MTLKSFSPLLKNQRDICREEKISDISLVYDVLV